MKKSLSLAKQVIASTLVAALLLLGVGQAANAAEPQTSVQIQPIVISGADGQWLQLDIAQGKASLNDDKSLAIIDETSGKVVQTLPSEFNVGAETFEAHYDVSEDGKSVRVKLPSPENPLGVGSAAAFPYKYDQVCVRNNVLYSVGTGALFGIAAGFPGMVVGAIVAAFQAGVISIASCKN